MRDLVFRLCLFLGLFVPAAGQASGAEPFRYKEGEHGKGKLKYVDGVPVLILEGSPKEMGEQTGVLAVRQAKPLYNFPRDYFLRECTNEIRRMNPNWKETDLQFKLAVKGAELVVWPKVQKIAVELASNLPEAHRKELEALITAGKADRHQLTAINGMFDLGHISQTGLLAGCSSMIIPPRHSDTGGLLFGRNLDFSHLGSLHEQPADGVPVDRQVEALVRVGRIPGFVGCFTGMNDAGLTIASHEVFEPDTTTLFNPKGVGSPRRTAAFWRSARPSLMPSNFSTGSNAPR